MSDSRTLEEELYKFILRLYAIQCARRFSKKTNEGRGMNKEFTTKTRSVWHAFVDDLCVLCDSLKGGDTTISVGVEKTASQIVYWICSNGQPGKSSDLQEAAQLLEFVLRKLVEVRMFPSRKDDFHREIFSRSVEFCRKRVAHYRDCIHRFLNCILKGHSLTEPEKQMIDKIRKLVPKSKTGSDLCEDAYNFRLTDSNKHLLDLAKSRPATWGYVRHNVGRLGCWYKAAKSLTTNAPELADALANFSVQIVPQNACRETAIPSVAEIGELFPNTCFENVDISLHRMTKIFGIDAMNQANEDLSSYFEGRWRLKYHAEANMADFFYAGDRQFLRGDRYIGCSKRSCYCCDLYFQLHPGEFVRRPCHENAWVQWQLPAMLISPHYGPQLTERMLQMVQGDVKRAMLNGLSGHAFTLDSTTNISSHVKPLEVQK